jgi:hypothetical protein
MSQIKALLRKFSDLKVHGRNITVFMSGRLWLEGGGVVEHLYDKYHQHLERKKDQSDLDGFTFQKALMADQMICCRDETEYLPQGMHCRLSSGKSKVGRKPFLILLMVCLTLDNVLTHYMVGSHYCVTKFPAAKYKKVTAMINNCRTVKHCWLSADMCTPQGWGVLRNISVSDWLIET